MYTPKSFIETYPNKSREEIQNIFLDKANSWLQYIKVRETLHISGLVKSNKSPEAEFAEWLVKTILNGNSCYNKSNKYFDIKTKDKIIQVKSISKSIGNNNGYKVSPKDRTNFEATHYAFVWFSEFVPKFIYLVETHKIIEYSKSYIGLSDLQKIGTLIEINLKPFSLY